MGQVRPMSALHLGCRLSDNPLHTATRRVKSSLGFPPETGTHSALPPAARRAKKGKATISFTTGAMIEPQSHLGSTSHGAFGTMSAGTFLTGIEVERPCGAWSCQATGSLGVSLMRPAGGLIQSSSPTFASSFSLQALKVTPEYDLYVELSQPLRVESGSVEVAYPSARTPDRKILTESFEAALSPDGRQIDFQAGVILPLSKNSKLGAQAWISHNPGHARHSPPNFRRCNCVSKQFLRTRQNIVHQIQRTATLAQNMTYTIYLELKPP